ARRRYATDRDRRPLDRRDAARPHGRDRGGAVPRGSVLPAQRRTAPRATAARTPGGHPGARPALRGAPRRAPPAGGHAGPRRHRGARGATVAGQRARPREHDRAPGRARRRPDHRAQLPRGGREPQTYTSEPDRRSRAIYQEGHESARAGLDPTSTRRDAGESDQRGPAPRDQPPRAALQDEGVRHFLTYGS